MGSPSCSGLIRVCQLQRTNVHNWHHARDRRGCRDRGGRSGWLCRCARRPCDGRTVVLTEPTDWIGGQLTSQAVPPDEHPWIEQFGAQRIVPGAAARRFATTIAGTTR